MYVPQPAKKRWKSNGTLYIVHKYFSAIEHFLDAGDDDDVVNDHHHLVALFGKWNEWKQNSEIFQLMLWLWFSLMSCCWCVKENTKVEWNFAWCACVRGEHSNSECLFMLLWSFNNTCAIQNTDGNLDYTLPLVSHRTHSDSSWGIASKARNVIPPHACILNFFVEKCNRNYVLKRLKSFSFTIRSQVREINYTIYYIYGTLFGLSSFLFFKYQLINILN